MQTTESANLFRQGLTILHRAPDYATLRETIQKMIAITPPQDIPVARDAIARVLRQKQAAELKAYEAYPQALEELDQKYKDLAIVLKQVAGAQPLQGIEDSPPAKTPTSATAQTASNPIVRIGPVPVPAAVLDWLKAKQSYLLAGTAALTTVSGAYYFYQKMFGEKSVKQDKESGFDKTIKSIQRYRLFSQLAKDPDFNPADAVEILEGKIDGKKKKIIKKKESDSAPKSSEWDYDERSLMKDMDATFNALSVRPKLNYELPQLPKPTNKINPKAIMKDEDIVETTETQIDVFEPKKKKQRKPRKPRLVEETSVKEASEVASEQEPSEDREDFSAKPEPKHSSSVSNGGRLIPIVKRTKRIKKVGT